MNREKANGLYDLLDDLFFDIKNDEIETMIIKIQDFLNNNFLSISSAWNLKK